MSRLLLIEPPARTSNEIELWRAMDDHPLTVVSDREGWGADRTVVLPARGVPLLGRLDGWAATPKWLVGLDADLFPDVAAVVSLELFAFCTAQAARLAAELGVPHIVHIAETMADNPLYKVPPFRTITRRRGVHADAFVCITERARQHAIALGCAPEACHVVHLGIDTEDFAPAPHGRAPGNHVLFVGALRADRGADKGVADVVEACRIARVHVPDLRLTVVGRGPLHEELAGVAAGLDWFELRDHMDRDLLPGLMRDARVLALGSKTTWKWEEQFGFVLVEAMACGLPVVATRSGAIPEVVPEGNPLVGEGSPADLAAGLVEMLGAAGDEIGRRNRRVAVERYEARTQAARLATVVDTVLAEWAHA